MALTFVLSGCANAPTFLKPASSITAEETQLYEIIVVLSAIVFLIVEGLLIYVLVRYRLRRADDEIPGQTYRNLLLESIWTAIPLILVTVLFIFTVRSVWAVAAPQPQTSDINVRVVGHRWWWEFDYPDLGIVTANELHVPVGGVVQIELESVDVVHSFWVPRLSGKTDVLPGQTNHMWFKAEELGVFRGHCAEYCGLNHANMRIHVVVESQADFQAWVANQQKPAAEPQTDLQKRGHDILTTGVCHNCHTVGEHTAVSPIGPNLTHLFSRSVFAGATYQLNEENVRRWIQHSDEMKPGNDMADVHPSADDVDALVAYLTGLK